MTSSRSLRFFDGLIAVLALAALLIQGAGGVSFRWGSIHVSASDGGRAALGALVLLIVRWISFRGRAFAFLPWIRGSISRARAFLGRRMGIDGGFYIILFALSLWVSLGPGAGLYGALYQLLPGFDFIRVPSRFTLLTVLALAVLAGFGLERVASRRRWLAPLVVALTFAELAAFPLGSRPYVIEPSAMDRWLATRSDGGAIVGLPISDPRDPVAAARRHSQYMLDSIAHFRPLVNGYSGFTPPSHDALFRKLVSFPSEDSLSSLEALGVRYAVLHRKAYTNEAAWKAVVERIESWPERLKLVQSFDEGRIYALSASVEIR
jgi:hypothetical protein